MSRGQEKEIKDFLATASQEAVSAALILGSHQSRGQSFARDKLIYDIVLLL
jgi:hypothetical protein